LLIVVLASAVSASEISRSAKRSACLRSVAAGGTGRDARFRVHACPEVLPPLSRDADVALIDLRGAFGEDVQEDHEPLRAAVEDAIQLPAVVAAELPQLPIDLRGVREGKMRRGVAQQIETPDLMLDRGLRVVVKGVEELRHRLATGRITIEDSLKVGHDLLPGSSR
jgi:hypothetical protein